MNVINLNCPVKSSEIYNTMYNVILLEDPQQYSVPFGITLIAD